MNPINDEQVEQWQEQAVKDLLRGYNVYAPEDFSNRELFIPYSDFLREISDRCAALRAPNEMLDAMIVLAFEERLTSKMATTLVKGYLQGQFTPESVARDLVHARTPQYLKRLNHHSQLCMEIGF